MKYCSRDAHIFGTAGPEPVIFKSLVSILLETFAVETML
jgi:hypothetical protein